jgi:Fe-S-cluster-containing dehydrogenase component
MVQLPRSGWVLIIDLNKCLGCQACAIACKTWWTMSFKKGENHIWWLIVETRPGPGYPKNWLEKRERGEEITDSDYEPYTEFRYENLRNNPTNEIPPKITPQPPPRWGPNWDWDIGVGNDPTDAWFFYLPLQCMHCDNAPCMHVCPSGAIYKRNDGIVTIDPQLCMGCQACVHACPYARMYWDKRRGVPSKCILCMPFVDKGEPPLCVRACPARARYFGRIDDPESPVYVIAKEYGVALPLLPQLGTMPRVLYIPPVLTPPKPDGSPRYDMKYLEKLFGKEVWRVKKILEEERKKGMKSKLMRVLTSYPPWKI